MDLNSSTLETGMSELNSLALAEYREPLNAVLSESDPQRRAIRIGRLVGVLLKEPFAEPEQLKQPSPHTSAYRAWHLVNPVEFAQRSRTDTWQHQAILQMKEALTPDIPYLAQQSEYDVAKDSLTEMGFFGFFARTLRKYICDDPAVKKKVEDALKEFQKFNKAIPILTPASIVGAGGLVLGAVLVQSVPILGFVGAPVIAAVIVILYTLGVDAFCGWSQQLYTTDA